MYRKKSFRQCVIACCKDRYKYVKEMVSFWCSPNYRKIWYRNKKTAIRKWIHNYSLVWRRRKINVHYFIFIHNRIGMFIRSYKLYRDDADGWNVRLYDKTGNLTHEGKGVYYHNCRKDWRCRTVDFLLRNK